MGIIRSLLFTALALVWTITLGIFFLPLLLATRPLAGKLVPSVWTRGILFLAEYCCGIRARVEGKEYLVQGTAAIYAMKHQSAYETLFLWKILPSPVFVLKRELLWIPVVGQYLARTPIIAIDRKAGKAAIASLLEQAKTHLDAGRQIVIFPEGTRTAPGDRKPYKSGIFALYEASGLPVIPVALNSGLCWRRNAFVKTPGVVTFRFLPPLPPGMERDAFMRRLEETVEKASLELLPPADHS